MWCAKRNFTLLLLVSFGAVLMSGCDGSDGAAGAPGAAGPQGPAGPAGPVGNPPPQDIGDATVIDPVITSVTIASPPAVAFTLVDEDGDGLAGLPAANISFAISRLVPGVDGNASEWQSYITREESADGSAPDELASATQATTENGSNGTLQDNGDGTYVYTFATDLDNAAVPFDAMLTHRVGFEIRGLAETTGNASFSIRPSDGATSGLFTREIVSDEACNKCHNKLSLHGGARFEGQYCVNCHNPGSTDQDTGNTVDMTVMIHKIHSGANLPSVIAGGEYAIYGFFEQRHDYSAVVFPQDIRNCRSCHDENNSDTPDAGNWLTVPTKQACRACHDDVNLDTGEGHSDANLAVSSNSDCTLCHSESGFVGPIDASHANLSQTAAEAFQYNIISVTNGGPGLFPSVTFSVTDPGNGDLPYDILNDAPFVQGGGASRLAIDLGWPTSDYHNIGSGSDVPGFRPGSPAQLVSINPLFGGATDNGDGTFTVTSSVAIPANVTGSGLVAIEGHPALDVDDDGSFDRLPAGGASDFFAITDSRAQSRRVAVSIENCLDCHQQLTLHGNNRTDNIDLCLGCHNANATDIRARVEAGVDASSAPDGKDEESIDFKRMIHAIHAGEERQDGLYVYGFGGSLHDYSDVVFPGNLNVCENCHVGEAYRPAGPSVLATTIDSGADLADPTDDVNITANTAVCSACHDSTLAAEHMKQNGGSFDAVQDASGTLVSPIQGTVVETCALCHGEGGIADVVDSHAGE